MDRFLTKPKPKPEASEPPAKRGKPSSAPKPAAEPRYCDCPVCGASVPFAIINQHIDSGCASRSPASQVPAPVLRPVAPQPAASAAAPAAASAPSAFGKMLAASKLANKVLNLGLLGDGRLSWSRPADGAATAWSCEVSVGPGVSKRKVRLHAAALPPATGPALSSGGAGPPRSTLSIPLLKSALQKNVRLCRAAAAVRVAAELLRIGGAEGKPSGAMELVSAGGPPPTSFAFNATPTLAADGVARRALGSQVRRLPILPVEDALPDPASYGVLVWAMAAHSKGMALTRAHEQLLLRAVHACAATPWRERCAAHESGRAPTLGQAAELAETAPPPAGVGEATGAEASRAAADLTGALLIRCRRRTQSPRGSATCT